MLVRELIVDAIVRVNLSKRGRNVPADIMQNAVELFNGIIRDYGNDNIMTAYQAMKDFDVSEDETSLVLGSVTPKRGYIVKEFYTLPDVSRYGERDFAYVDGKFYKVDDDEWVECEGSECCDYIPDVVVNDLSDIVNISYKDGNKWVKLPKPNYADFYTDGRDKIFSSRPVGENKVEILVRGMAGRTLKMIYTNAMRFDENSRLEVPAKYIPLLTYAMCYELGCSYPAVDSSITAEFKAKKQDMEGKVLAANDNDRMLLREESSVECDKNRVDMVIRNG